MFQVDPEGARHKRGADHHRRLHVPLLRQSRAVARRPEGGHPHRQEGGGPGHCAGPLTHQRGRRRHLHGQPGQRRQENTA